MLERLAYAHTPEWHALRKTVVTASRSASLMLPDLPWSMSEEELAEDIRGGVWLPEPQMEAGTHFEFANVSWLAQTLGVSHEEDGALWADSDLEGIGATPDHWLFDLHHTRGVESDEHLTVHDTWGSRYEGDAAVTFLRRRVAERRLMTEAKQTRSKYRSKWKKEDPPDHYYNQCQHQMLVMGETDVLLFAKVDSYELYGYLIERDTEYCMRLKDACQEFWRNYLL